eukprot:scaffold74423_cov27-Tisochrysis_lutea.AAC.12
MFRVRSRGGRWGVFTVETRVSTAVFRVRFSTLSNPQKLQVKKQQVKYFRGPRVSTRTKIQNRPSCRFAWRPPQPYFPIYAIAERLLDP